MMLNEVARLFGVSRRTIMRRVAAGKLPPPTDNAPMSWSAREIRAAHKRARAEEKRNGRHRARKQ